jgi:hypothetical protein
MFRTFSVKKIRFLVTVIVLITSSSAIAEVKINGSLEVKNQSGIHEGEVYHNFLKADLELGQNLNNTVFKVRLRAEDDTMRPEDNGDNYLRDDNKGPRRIYLHEAFISHDIYFEQFIDSINFKLGRIIYTWGNADEMKPVDIINPQDYSNLYFTQMQDRKIGVLSGSMSVYFSEHFFIEGVVIPESRPSEIASSVFITKEVREMKENTSIYHLNDADSPENKNSENSYAGRIGITVLDIDMHANYFYGYDHLPVNEMAYGMPIQVTPLYKQIQMFGLDFQRALFLGITLRGEASYYDRGKYFSYKKSYITADLMSGGDGVTEKEYAQYTAGFDDHDFIFDDLYLNLQFHQKIIMDYESTLSQGRYISMVLWNIKYFLANKKYRLSAKGAYDTGDRSLYANAEFMVKFNENFEFMIGGWMIEGDSDTDIGQFDPYDMVYVAGKLTF